jgi:hypothetical protein
MDDYQAVCGRCFENIDGFVDRDPEGNVTITFDECECRKEEDT